MMENAVPQLAAEFNGLRAKEYNSSAAYRITEALRNHAQHRGFPIGALSTGGEWVERADNDEVMLYRISAYIDVEAMREGGKTKKLILADLENLGSKPDVRRVLREYVASLSSIHEAMRRKLDEALTTAETEIAGAIERWEAQFPEENSYVGLAAVEVDEAGLFVSQTAIFSKFIDRRKHLVQRNSHLVNLSRRHVTSEPKRRSGPSKKPG